MAERIEWQSDRVYTREEVLAFWRISPATLAEWQKDGLPVLSRGMRTYFYYGADVISFIRGTITEERAAYRRRGFARPKHQAGPRP